MKQSRFAALVLGVLLLLPLALTATNAQARPHHRNRSYTTRNNRRYNNGVAFSNRRYNNGGGVFSGRSNNNTRKEDKQRRTYEKFVTKRERDIRRQNRR